MEMISCSCITTPIFSLYRAYIRHLFSSAGLRRRPIQIDPETTLHCWIPSSTSSKPPLLLIHGFGPSALWQWRHQLSSLSPFFSLYIPDLVFFGSSYTTSSHRSEVFQASCVAKMVDELRVHRFSVLGTSYGGFVAYNLARMCGERVEKVVIASSGLCRTRSDQEELLRKAGVERISDLMLPQKPEQFRSLIALSVYRPPPFLPDFILKQVIQALYMEKREKKIELLMGLTIGRDDTITISPIQQEVLIIWGEHDHVFPLEMAYELKKYLGDNNVRVEVIAKTSHVPQIENPKQFNKIVKSFLMKRMD